MAIQGPQCAMPGCTERWKDAAHIEGSGMGGRASTYVIENMVGLCRADHMIFDGHVMQGRQRMMRRLNRLYLHSGLAAGDLSGIPMTPVEDPQVVIDGWVGSDPEARVLVFDGASKLSVTTP